MCWTKCHSRVCATVQLVGLFGRKYVFLFFDYHSLSAIGILSHVNAMTKFYYCWRAPVKGAPTKQGRQKHS
ncbi:hypothetical protein LZ24_03087 [Desulfobotulus alkaliphilus]|uniref:Uncharacterized protein n=1 Tax=Desulfobotulus alkaliphilus TaxID=622671 RepID=A0A562R6W6_9BACT|nr:hypothetical protein LZ24_03087 [Desulfobotulus alkaliphilus]